MAHDFALAFPFLLTLDVTGTEDQPPAFLAEAHLAIPGQGAEIAFRGRVFLSLANWDGMAAAVAARGDAAAALEDFDGQFALRFARTGGAARLRVEAGLLQTLGATALSHETPLDAEGEAALRAAFQAFPVWW